MLSRLSHPLAFATVPLDGTPMPEYGQESFYVVGGEEQTGSMGDTIVPITKSMAGTILSSPPPSQQRQQGRDARDPRESTKTLEEYGVENRQLKIAVDQLSRKVASYKEVISPTTLHQPYSHNEPILNLVHRQLYPRPHY